MEMTHATSPTVTPFRHKDKATEGWGLKRKIAGHYTYNRFQFDTVNGVKGRMWVREVDNLEATKELGEWRMWEPLDGSEGWVTWIDSK